MFDCLIHEWEEYMSSKSIEQFLEVFVCYSALSPNSPKVYEQCDGMTVSKALVKIPVSGLDYHDTMVNMLENEKYQDMHHYFHFSHLEDEKLLFHEMMSKIAKEKDLGITSDRKSRILYLQLPLDTASDVVNQFQRDVEKTFVDKEQQDGKSFATMLDLKMRRFVEHFQLKNYIDRIYQKEEKQKVKKLKSVSYSGYSD